MFGQFANSHLPWRFRYVLYDIPPAPKENYSKEVMTDLSGTAIAEALARVATSPRPLGEDDPGPGGSPSRSPVRSTTGNDSFVSDAQTSVTFTAGEHAALSAEALRAVTTDPGFQDFVTRASLLMERALSVNVDVMMSSRCAFD